MYLFQNFLEDHEEYAKSEKLWAQTLLGIVKHLGQQQHWKIPWVKPRFADGTPHQDGNPMFTALDRSRRIAVIIIQGPLEADSETDFVYWTKTLAKGEPEEAEALVISCVLSDETLAKAGDLMMRWARDGSLKGSARPIKAHPKARDSASRRRASRA